MYSPVLSSLLLALTVLLAACGPSADSPSAEACARVAQQVRGLPERVKVMDAVDTAEGQVEIAYEYSDEQDLQVAGSATCTFAVGGPGSLQLLDAIVDGEPVAPADLTAANRALSKGRP